MSKEYTIQIEGVPEGWEVEGVSIHPPKTTNDPYWMRAAVKLRKTKLGIEDDRRSALNDMRIKDE
ncbi:MAG: hypothetical protein H0X02_06760 [Nitrosomonas sp.]|nr:hypothetical protein [Nitrosomonas sp.]